MRSLDQLSSGSSSCSPVLSDDSFDPPSRRMFAHVPSPAHSVAFAGARHLLMPACSRSSATSYTSDSSCGPLGAPLSPHSARFGLNFGQLPSDHSMSPSSTDRSFSTNRLSAQISFDFDRSNARRSNSSDVHPHHHSPNHLLHSHHYQLTQSAHHSPSSYDDSSNDHSHHAASLLRSNGLNSPATSSKASGSSVDSALGSPDFERPTRGKIKICGVCGDRAKSFHFGAISCDSCKAFFRRSVQNEAYKNFHCPYNNRCDITILSRKCCQHCR